MALYESKIATPVQSMNQLFSPKLLATSFKSDTIKISIQGDLNFLDGIGDYLFLFKLIFFTT